MLFRSGGATGSFQVKVGVRRVDYPVPRIQEPLRIEAYPLSFWVVREFNRRLLDQPDPQIAAIREACLDSVLGAGESILFECPTALYVHLAVLSSDNKLLIVEKNYQLSALARRGLRWSCAVEEGLIWHKDVKGGSLDLRRVAERGLRTELAVASNLIRSVNWFGLALETTHLNLGVLGLARLGLSGTEILKRVTKSEELGPDCRLIPLDEVYDLLFRQGADFEGSWHPTARLRALLALYSINGRERALARESGA